VFGELPFHKTMARLPMILSSCLRIKQALTIPIVYSWKSWISKSFAQIYQDLYHGQNIVYQGAEAKLN
jgi:hypothetical protein